MSKLRLKAYVSFEQGKSLDLIQLSHNKDAAVNALTGAYKGQIEALRKQVDACEKAYNSVFDSTRFYLATAKANNDAANQTLKSLEYHTNERIAYLEDEKKALKKQSTLQKWLFGGAGVGVGALIFGIISVVK